MKKYIVIIVLCMIVCGCGCKKKTKESVDNNGDIGVNDVTYKLSVTCLDKSAQSTLFLGKDKSFYYNLYECSGNNLHLITGSGSYKINDTTVVLTDNYDKKWNVSVNKDKVEIELNGNIHTLTK